MHEELSKRSFHVFDRDQVKLVVKLLQITAVERVSSRSARETVVFPSPVPLPARSVAFEGPIGRTPVNGGQLVGGRVHIQADGRDLQSHRHMQGSRVVANDGVELREQIQEIFQKGYPLSSSAVNM